MKRLISLSLAGLMLIGFAGVGAKANESQKVNFEQTIGAKDKSATFKVNGVCGMCKKKIESTAKGIAGVKTAVWDKETKDLKVTFDSKKTSEKKIQEAIAKIGYNAGNVKADKDAMAKLPACCKEGGKHSDHKACD
ncbi:MAG: heavy-metal-associated domain-containing protein [Bacteroidales bacterium]|nr:heavy-metal-associated domain-containing protein [Bacteroidales bacterium]